ncbi:acetyl-coenzyme A carboxylase carboxyl transferase subunit alpha, chloroplastic-like [Chenopodium quinoa]|uniref:acetyl-coenzyme A carboxylase carboxyl transferase subunit alpha, chloroplastic-like n=1 Tax=Chenopodium quinoa TaxID=63459 RepID=UPI000B78E7F1|nr:acetyl-coenzyme A carboxylase carboxyl transferase subunit alpha, chloroplastic-like [Chenopodium quinoa]
MNNEIGTLLPGSRATGAPGLAQGLRSSNSSLNGIPLRELGMTRTRLLCVGKKKMNLSVSAKLRKVKKHEYPWPEDPDLNVKGGILTHLSPFKPLKTKPKPVTLDFEKPLMDLQKKIIDVRKMANETGLDFSDQIASLENKYQQALKELYLHLTPIQRVNIARHPNRPTFLDHVFNITEKFVELHGDRAGYDDPAIVTGLGTIDGRSYMFIGHQKGRNTKENIERNFGMPTPHGYRKALRMMYYADHHGFPIVTFIDTPGAYADLKSEELGQGEAIAHNLRTMFGLKVPIISIVIGEGGSGGALAIGCANKLLMLENAVFYVASPEACAAILWKSAKAAPKAAEKLRITANELCRLQVADGVIPEPLGGAHADSSWTSQQIKKAIVESMDELVQMDIEELLHHRTQKFRKIGGFQEGLPVDPKKKVNMKKKEEPLQSKASTLELENEVEKLKEQILKSKDLSIETPNVDEMIQKLRQEVDHEFSEAAEALGLKNQLLKLREELSKARNAQDNMHPMQLERVEKFKDDFSQRLSAAPNYESLSYKLDMLKELSKAKKISESKSRSAMLKQEVNKKFKEILNHPDVKKKVEMLKSEIKNSGASTPNDFDHVLKNKIMEVKKEIEVEFANVLKSLDLDLKIAEPNAVVSVDGSLPLNLKSMIGELNEEIQGKIQNTVNTSELRDKIDLLKLELAKAGKNADAELQNRIQALTNDIKKSLAQTLSTSELVEKHGKLRSEIEKVLKSNGISSKSPDTGSKVDEINIGAGRSYA